MLLATSQQQQRKTRGLNEMKDYVSIKSSRHGLEVHLDPQIPFTHLLEEVSKKFSLAAKFFAHSSLAISFEDRPLTKEQEQQLLDIITETAHITIICVIDNNKTTEQLYRTIIEQSTDDSKKRDGQFYRGTLKRRQVLESETSVIILGNVENGAKVISKGNVVVMGSLKGSVHAGASGDHDAFITALDMNPKVLKIGNISIKRHKIQETDENIMKPKIAIVDGEHIYIDPLI